MGFKEARDAVIDCLRSGDIGHWPREDLHLKNWLAAGRLTEEEVIRLLQRCNGKQYRPGNQVSPAGGQVHEFFPVVDDVNWYIKVYVDEETNEAIVEAVFMSVHPSGE